MDVTAGGAFSAVGDVTRHVGQWDVAWHLGEPGLLLFDLGSREHGVPSTDEGVATA